MLVKMLAVSLSVTLLGTVASAATAKKTVPNTITTTDGKTYRMTRLVSATPEGLVVEYRPGEGGVGVRLLRFRDLPEDLRREFNYDEDAARQHEQARSEAISQWRERFAKEAAAERTVAEGEPASVEGSGTAQTDAGQFPVGRFRASATIRGAMIVDTITGESWLSDLHSVLNDYQDLTYFLQPKIQLPPRDGGKVVIIGP